MRISAIAAMSASAQDHGPEAKMVNRLRDSKSPYVSIPSSETRDRDRDRQSIETD